MVQGSKDPFEEIRKACDAMFPLQEGIAHLGHNAKMATRSARLFMLVVNHGTSPEEVQPDIERIMVQGWSFEDALSILDEHFHNAQRCSIDDIMRLRALRRFG